MLFIQIYMPLIVYGAEVRSVETEGTVSFTGVYETPGTPDPAPEVGIKPVLPKEITQPPSNVVQVDHIRLPKTSDSRMIAWKILGILIIVVTLSFWSWKHKSKKTKKESRT
ncbi:MULTISPECIES: LPXTG cell wall anchor domain-containing protein [unclassified Enterococcus]|nr:LPXTG cell wall anchor domain-containing protein [Enterococcus sp. DIV1298c]